MSAAHTSEPWLYDAQGHQGIITDKEQFTVILAECPSQPGPAGLVGRQLSRIVACVNACAGIANFPENGLKVAMLDSAFAWEKAKHERDILEAALRKVCQQPFTPSTNGERWDEGFEKGWRAAMDGAYSIVRRALEEATK